MPSHPRTRSLTPEEDAIGDPEELDEEIDDLLPADLWFRDTASPAHSWDW